MEGNRVTNAIEFRCFDKRFRFDESESMGLDSLHLEQIQTMLERYFAISMKIAEQFVKRDHDLQWPLFP